MPMLKTMFWDISDPHSSNYGKYLQQQQITDLVAPEDHVLEEIRKWIESVHHRSIKLVAHRDAFIVNSTVEATERLFGVKLTQFHHPSTKKVLTRAATPVAVPAHLAPHVDFVSGLSHFPRMKILPAPPTLARRSELASNAPIVNETGGNEQNLIIAFIPVCKDGSLSSESASSPCSDHPPTATGAIIYATPTYPATTYKYTMSASFFSQACGWRSELQNVACAIQYSGSNWPVPYVLHSVSVQVLYSDGTSSINGTAPYYSFSAPYPTPPLIKTIYGIPADASVSNSSITQGVASFNGEYYNPGDVSQFLNSYNIPISAITVIGYNDADNPGGEATLDMEMETSIAPGAPVTFVSMDEGDNTIDWAITINDLDNPPLVNSISYGNGEYATYEASYNRGDNEFIKMGLVGVSVLVSSGDGGASQLDTGGSCSVALPDWPATSPYVTGVGATTFSAYTQSSCFPPNAADCSKNAVGEITASALLGSVITSGGGFSLLYSRPNFQNDFVNEYLTTIGSSIPASFTSSTSGRAFPDIAAVGHNLPIVISGDVSPQDGTSASSPIAAGIITLLNNVRSSRGLPPLGYLNPLLYQIKRDHPTAFNDITIGDNSCGTDKFVPCCDFGYPATTGWDAVTGLGSINYTVMSSVINNYTPQPFLSTTSEVFGSFASALFPHHQLMLLLLLALVAMWLCV